MPRTLKRGISCSSLIEGYSKYLQCRVNSADGDQMAEQLINFGFDTEAIRSAIASSAGPLNPSIEQQLEATVEILLQAPVALNEAIVESSSTAIPLTRSSSAAACCLVLEEQKDNFTVLVTEDYRLHSPGVAQPGVPDVTAFPDASVAPVNAVVCQCVSWTCEICTYVNESVNRHCTCDMCNSPKPVEAAPAEDGLGRESTPADELSNEPSSPTWLCHNKFLPGP